MSVPTMDGDNKNKVELRNFSSCQSSKTSLHLMLDARCKIICASAEIRTASQKGECLVDCSKSVPLASLEELHKEFKHLVEECFRLMKDHALEHPAHGGRQATDSGYCNSSDMATMTNEPVETVGIAERQDYPSNADDHQPNSLPDLQSLHLNNGNTLKRSVSHC